MASTLVGLAKKLEELGQVQQVKDVKVDKDDFAIMLLETEEQYIVSDAQPNGSTGKTVGYNLYNLDFYHSTTGKVGLPRIDHNQNKNILIDEAYKQLGYLPAICTLPNDAISYVERTDMFIKREIKSIFPAQEKPDKIDIANIRYYVTDKEAFDELFFCKCTKSKQGEKNETVAFSFRYQRGRDNSNSQTDRIDVNDNNAERPIAIELNTEAEKLYTEEYKKHKMNYVDMPKEIREQGRLENSLNKGLDILLNEKNVNDMYADCHIYPKSIKYWKRIKTRVRFGANILPPTDSSIVPLFENAVMIYEADYYPAMDGMADNNIYRCPTPSCTNYYRVDGSEFERSMRLNVDPNWRKTTTSEDYRLGIGEGKFRHAVGCQSCMSASCGFCGQRYFTSDKFEQLQNYHGYVPSPKRIFLNYDNRIKKILANEKEGIINHKKTDSRSIADFCECQHNIHWFDDEMYMALKIDQRSAYNRVILRENIVFVNIHTQEVVAAFTPKTLKDKMAELEQLYVYAENGHSSKKQIGKDKMLVKKMAVFFSDYFDANISNMPNDVAKIKDFSEFNKKDGTHYLDNITAEGLLRYCKSIYPEATTVEIHSLRNKIIETLKDKLNTFKYGLSKAINPMGSKSNKNDIFMASILDCKLCTCCGSLYYVYTEHGDEENKILSLEMNTSGDVCDPNKFGRWARPDGFVFYRSKNDAHINNRTVITEKGGEIVFEQWQKIIKQKLGIK